ncbi:MAG: hypothetical protein OEL20_04875 [Sulfuritalea sp.]|nr:hypothetical protein [Sulfuritalea sp.]
MFIASLDTSNFTFTALGETSGEARAALQRGLREHGVQYKLPADWFQEFADAIHLDEVMIGDCLRDHEPMHVRPGT